MQICSPQLLAAAAQNICAVPLQPLCACSQHWFLLTPAFPQQQTSWECHGGLQKHTQDPAAASTLRDTGSECVNVW